MKKTLLCFLFLFTTVFYAQVTSITICETEPFNLTSLKADFIGNLNPDETTVSYHLSLEDATNNTNLIANPTNYIGTPGITKIYGRIDNNGTITTNYFNLTVLPSLNVSASNTPVLCQGSNTASLTINVSPSGSYQYSINGSLFTSNNHYNNLVAGFYTIKVKSTNPICPDVTINHVITEPATLNTTAMISGQMATITAIGGTPPYQYSLEGISYQPSPVFQNLTPGNHIFMVRDGNDCIATVPATVLPALTATAIITKEMDCSANSNASIAVFAAGGQSPYTYSLNGSPFQVNNNFSNLISGTYSITAKDAVNTISNPTAITINPLVVLSATALVINPTNCSTGTITAIATGGKAPYIYSFDGGMTFTSSNVFSAPNPGTYVIIVKDSKGCLSSSVTTTIQPATPLVITASNTSILCNGVGDASLTITATGGKAPYQYAINNGVYTSSNIFTTLNAGTYTLKVRDAAGCVSTINHAINQPTVLTVLLSTSGQNITLTSSGGTAPYQYSLDGGSYQTSNVFTVLTSGNYLIEVRDSNGCTRTFATSVVVPDPLISSAILVKESDCISGASIAVNAAGGKPPYAYSINGGASYQLTNTFTNVPAGTYTVKVKDFANTFSNSNTIVVNSPSPITATTVVTPSDCINNSITVQATGGQVPYIYSIDGGITYGPANVFTNVLTGTYNIVIKDSNSCVSPILSTIVQSPSPLVITASDTSISCYGGTASIIINPVGGQAPYEYSINNSPYTISNIYSGLNAGTYTIRARDAIGCSSEFEYVITQPTSILSNINIEGQTVTVIATGGTAPYQYSADNVNFQYGNVFTNLSSGQHNVFVKDANGCESSYNVTIEDPIPLTSTAAITKPLNCGVKATITVTAAGGIAPYQYSIDGGLTYKTANVFTTLNAGTYNAVVKDAANTISNTTTIVIDPLVPLVVDVAIIRPLDCTGSATIKATVTGGLAPYLYSVDNGPNSLTNTFNVYAARNYTVNILDNAGCIVRKVITIAPYTPIAMSTAITNVSCNGNNNGLIRVTATGGIAPFTYSIGAGYQSGNTFSNLAPGNYTVSVKDKLGCIVTKPLVITQPSALASTIDITNATCFNSATGTITVNASGGTVPYSYSINGTDYFSNKTFNNLIAGIYNVSVKDSKGCSMSFYTTISQSNSLAINLTKSDVNCNGSQDGEITATATGGNAPYTYSIGTGYTSSNTFSGLAPGLYNVTAKDVGGCTTTSTIIIAQPASLSLSVSIINPTSSMNSDGKITVAASGGTAPYFYSLKNSNGTEIIAPQTFSIFTNLTSGSYVAELTDARGCTFLQPGITIVSPPALVATTNVIPLTCNSNGIITVSAIGGTAPYQYSFDNGITYTTSNVFSTSTPGSYAIKVRDYQYNTTSLVATIDPVNPLLLMATIVSPITCTQNGSIIANVIGGQAPYVYSLNGSPFQSSNLFNVPAGSHIISVRDSNGCTAISAVELTAPLPITASLTVVDQTVTITAVGGSGKYLYAISPNTNLFSANNTFTNLESGNYTVIVRDESGCYVMLNFVINPPAPLIEDKEAITVDFKPGQTLADLIVEGQNIKWYSTPNALEGKTSKTNETPLPLTTILVNGTTYYASQTVNGIESKERLAVTAKLNGALSTPDFVLANFKFYPNPVQDTLTINNTAVIDEVEIVSVTGQSILSKTINSDHSEIDLSNVSSGVYLLKVKSEGKTKTVKIVKK
jgi:hypothetical protein